MAKTAAERMREYRARKKAQKPKAADFAALLARVDELWSERQISSRARAELRGLIAGLHGGIDR